MKTTQANLLNVLALIAMPIWAILSFEPTLEKTNNYTALIPLAIGVLLLLCNKGIKNQDKKIAHIAVVLTLLAIGGLVNPLLGALEDADNIAVIRVSIMIFTSVIAMITFIRSFIAARKK